jgi:hypothetical protein
MPDSTPNVASHNRMHAAIKQGWDIDFIRAKFNVSSKEVEKAIRYAGTSREKLIEYFRSIFPGK